MLRIPSSPSRSVPAAPDSDARARDTASRARSRPAPGGARLGRVAATVGLLGVTGLLPLPEPAAAAPSGAGSGAAPVLAADGAATAPFGLSVAADTVPDLRGTVTGRVELDRPPPRRAPSRYSGRGGPAARRVQDLPAVVYLRGGPERAAPPEVVMAQRDTAFVPGVLVVPVGTTVAFPNRDPFFHNVFSYSSPARFDLGRYPTGESKSVTFDEPGVVNVYCEVHEFMRGAVVVTRTGRHAVVADDGSFVLEDVPAGEWTLVAWHADLGEVERTVRVPDGGSVDVTLSLGGPAP